MENKNKNKMNVEELFPEELAIKIYAEYAPAPDPDRVFFRITIQQQVDMRVWVYMVTFVTINNKVIPTKTRKYPRELEHALMNYAKSLETTLLNSDIQFNTNAVNCWTAGLIGPLTRKQNRCNCCHERKFHSYSITTKFQMLLHDRRPDNTTNINYLQHLVKQAMEKVKSRNRISVYKQISEPHQVTLWMSLQKPMIPISRVLCKAY